MPLSKRLLGTVRVNRWSLRCERCGHTWELYGDLPRSCASCKSRYWATKRGTLKRGRPQGSGKGEGE
jgi:hypothetical protein